MIATETSAARNRRILINYLQRGGKVLSRYGSIIACGSGSSDTIYQVTRWIDERGARWEHCECAHAQRYGDFMRLGTQDNGVKPCAHMIAARLCRMTDTKRAEVLAADAELRKMWQA